MLGIKTNGVRDRCAYSGCENGRHNTGSRLYRFPYADKDRLAIWIENSGNEQLKSLAPDTIRDRGLCGKHFSPKYFESGSRLAPTAVPHVCSEPERSSTKKRPYCRRKPVEGQRVPLPSTILVRVIESPEQNIKDQDCIPSTSPINIPTDGSTSVAENSDRANNEHFYKYQNIEVEFCKTDDENFEWLDIEPVQSAVPICEPVALEALHEEIRSLRKQLADAKDSNTTLERRSIWYRKVIHELRRKLRRASGKNLRKKQIEESADTCSDSHESLEPVAQTMVELQVHPSEVSHPEDLAKQLYYSATRLRTEDC